MKRPMVAICLLGMVSCCMASGDRTYFTPERIANAKRNVELCAWAQAELQSIMEAWPTGESRDYTGAKYVGAARMVQKTDDEIFALVPAITIPRKWSVDPTATCPVHGTAIRARSGFYPWLVDFEQHPYRVKCPVGGELYPSNDFAAGDMTSGDYPDDGSGCAGGEAGAGGAAGAASSDGAAAGSFIVAGCTPDAAGSAARFSAGAFHVPERPCGPAGASDRARGRINMPTSDSALVCGSETARA